MGKEALDDLSNMTDYLFVGGTDTLIWSKDAPLQTLRDL